MKRSVAGKFSKNAGIIIMLAAAELVLFVLLAQHLYPNYSLNYNYISDLGVNPATAIIFNTAIQLFGVVLIAAAYLLFRSGRKYQAIGFLIAAIGGIGVGTFPETTGFPHIFSALVVFGSISIASICFSRVFKAPLSYYSLATGLLALIVLGISVMNMLGAQVNLPLGHGGVEEILFYDELIWAFVAGISYLKGRI
ncbi:MAG: DUF998 domain-containing protein [Candidatus Micrarchaeota archaeon]|nr:DUF998 domain-containing protein [Candidatus Micrarchaeota archaeon]